MGAGISSAYRRLQNSVNAAAELSGGGSLPAPLTTHIELGHDVCRSAGYEAPILCTPDELMGEESSYVDAD